MEKVTNKLIHRREMIKEYQTQLRVKKIDEIDKEYRRINELLDQIKQQEREKALTTSPL